MSGPFRLMLDMDLQINGRTLAGDVTVREYRDGQREIVGRFGVAAESTFADFVHEKLSAQGDEQLVRAEGKVLFKGDWYAFACNVRFSDMQGFDPLLVDFYSDDAPSKWEKVVGQ